MNSLRPMNPLIFIMASLLGGMASAPPARLQHAAYGPSRKVRTKTPNGKMKKISRSKAKRRAA